MKICFITDTIFNLGGVQRVLSVIANELSKEHEVTVLCTNNKYVLNREVYGLSESVKVDISNLLLTKRNIFEKVFYRFVKFCHERTKIFGRNIFFKLIEETYYPQNQRDSLKEYLQNKNFDIIVGVEGVYSILLASISSELKAKTIGWQHNSYDAYLKTPNKYYWKQDMLFKKYIPKLDRYFVLNEYDKQQYFKEMDIECDVLYNPISFESIHKSEVNNKVFLAAGRFTYQKGFDLLIKSFYEFSKYNDDWKLVLVGEGEELKNIQKLIRKYKLQDRITVKQFSSNIKHYFLESSALVLSSRWEGMPMIVLESLVMGVPIISYDITAMRPLVTNYKEGIIVEKYNTEKFAKAMYEISNSYELRKRMSENAILKSNKFKIENIINRWNDIIREILE